MSYRVAYVGYSSSWNETVPAARVRPDHSTLQAEVQAAQQCIVGRTDEDSGKPLLLTQNPNDEAARIIAMCEIVGSI